tara:strand:+ start:9199 stop:11859 length:2661 start_codon:yes stop_codon:yes gene_type:complete
MTPQSFLTDFSKAVGLYQKGAKGDAAHGAIPPVARVPSSKREKGQVIIARLVPRTPEQIAKSFLGKGVNITEKTKEDVASIRTSVKSIHTILKKTTRLDKKRLELARRRREQQKRKKVEDKNESGIVRDAFDWVTNLSPVKKPIDAMKNFLGNILLGWLFVRLVDFAPQLEALSGPIKSIIGFGEWLAKGIFEGLVGFIEIGYNTVDSIEFTIEKLFGDTGVEKFKEFQGLFTKFMNMAIIAAILGSGGPDMGGNRRRGRNSGEVGIQGKRNQAGRVTRGGTTSQAARRYADRFGKDAAIKKFGQDGVKSLGGKYARSGATNLARKGAVAILGKGGTKAGLKILKNVIGPVVKRIPIIGGLIDFALNYFVFKEPLGRSAFAAIGSTIFGALGATAGSVIPIVGNIVGGALGGLAGDAAGKWLYDTFFANKKPVEEKVETKKDGGTVGEDERQKRILDKARNARLIRFSPPPNEKLDPKKPQQGNRGGIFERLLAKMNGDKSPFKAIGEAVKKLRKTNSSIISKIMSMGIDLASGKVPDRRSIQEIAKNLVTFFDAAIPAPMYMLRNLLQKLATGGMVVLTPMEEFRRNREIANQVERTFMNGVMKDTRDALQSLNKISGKSTSTPYSPSGDPGTTSPTGTSYPTTPMAPAPPGRTQGGSSNLASVGGMSYTPYAKGSGAVFTSGFGLRDSPGGIGSTDHKGVDIAAAEGTPLYAYLDGEVTHVNTAPSGPGYGGAGYGYWIVWKDSVHGAYHFFGHMQKPPGMKVGAKFKAGELLGLTGNTGKSTGPHLHWEISKTAPAANGQFSSYVDPVQWINTHGKGGTAAQVATSKPNTGAQDVADKASYEQTGTTVAVIEKTVKVRVGTNSRGRPIYRNVPADSRPTVSAT